MLKKVIVFAILGVYLFSSFSFFVTAYNLNDSEISAEGCYLYNFENDLIIVQDNIYNEMSASSTVKIMSACIALEADIPLNQPITVTKEMVTGVTGRFMGLKDGDIITYEDLLYAMICASFNDATHVIAYYLAGSLDSYVEMMNSKAADLCMSSTYYADVTGMSIASKTSISDIIKLVKYMLNKQEYIAYTSSKSHNLSSVSTCDYNKITNRSDLLSSYKGFSNINIGSGVEGGDCAVSYINNGKSSFLCIVMNAISTDGSGMQNIAELYTKRLLNHGLYDYSYKTVLSDKAVLDSLPVKYSISDDTVNIYVSNDIQAFILNEINVEDFDYNYYLYESELISPLSAGDKVGVVIVSHNGRYIGSSPVIVRENINRNFFLFIMDCIKSYLASKAFLISLISFAVLCLIYYKYRSKSFDKMFGRNQRKKTRYVK